VAVDQHGPYPSRSIGSDSQAPAGASEASLALEQKLEAVDGTSPSSGNAKSRCSILPMLERVLANRRPKPTSLSSRGSRRRRDCRPRRGRRRRISRRRPEQAPEIIVGEVALLDGELRARVAALVAQRVAAQALVAADLERVVEIELFATSPCSAANSRRRSDWRRYQRAEPPTIALRSSPLSTRPLHGRKSPTASDPGRRSRGSRGREHHAAAIGAQRLRQPAEAEADPSRPAPRPPSGGSGRGSQRAGSGPRSAGTRRRDRPAAGPRGPAPARASRRQLAKARSSCTMPPSQRCTQPPSRPRTSRRRCRNVGLVRNLPISSPSEYTSSSRARRGSARPRPSGYRANRRAAPAQGEHVAVAVVRDGGIQRDPASREVAVAVADLGGGRSSSIRRKYLMLPPRPRKLSSWRSKPTRLSPPLRDTRCRAAASTRPAWSPRRPPSPHRRR
jgi:hypothetical protein